MQQNNARSAWRFRIFAFADLGTAKFGCLGVTQRGIADYSSEMPAGRRKSVLISGAGIAGPTLAYWLRRRGFEPTIVERAPQFRTGGYMLDFWGVGFDVAERMNILPALRQAGYVNDQIAFVGRDGHRRSSFGGAPIRRHCLYLCEVAGRIVLGVKMASLSVEMRCLFAAMVLALLHLTAASFSFKAQVGNRYTVGARDEDIRPSGVAGRLYRAQWNFLETFPVFVAAVLMNHVLQTSGSVSMVGALLYIGGRMIFLPLYALGVPWLRTFSWNIATLGLALVMAQLFL